MHFPNVNDRFVGAACPQDRDNATGTAATFRTFTKLIGARAKYTQVFLTMVVSVLEHADVVVVRNDVDVAAMASARAAAQAKNARLYEEVC